MKTRRLVWPRRRLPVRTVRRLLCQVVGTAKSLLTSIRLSIILSLALKSANPVRELSSAGRASALQAEGHRFEPCSSHQIQYGAVVQPVRMPACHAGGRGFEPLLRRHFAQIAQSVEQWTENPRVAGSIPALGTKTRQLNDCRVFCAENQHRLDLTFRLLYKKMLA